MKIIFSSNSWDEFQSWMDEDPKVATKIRDLIKSCARTPHEGIGKPEALKGQLQGWYSRRITQEHRLVYRVIGKKGIDQRIEIAQCKFHY